MKKLLTIVLLVSAYAQVDATSNLTTRLATNFMKKMNPSTFTPKNVAVNAAKGLAAGFVSSSIGIHIQHRYETADDRYNQVAKKRVPYFIFAANVPALLAGGIPGVIAHASFFSSIVPASTPLPYETMKKWTIEQIKEYKHNNNGLDS